MQVHYRTGRRSGVSIGGLGFLILVPFILAAVYASALFLIGAFLVGALMSAFHAPHRLQGLLLALAALAAVIGIAMTSNAGAATVATYPLGHAKHCQAHYVKRTLRHVVKGHTVRYVGCVYVAPLTPTLVAPATPKIVRASIDPTYTQDETNPLKVTFAYSAAGVNSDLAPGVLSLYWGPAPQSQSLACSTNVGGILTGGACRITFPAYGPEYVTTTYYSGTDSATQTETEDIEDPHPPAPAPPLPPAPPVKNVSNVIQTPFVTHSWDFVYTTTTTFTERFDTSQLPLPDDPTASLGTASIIVTRVVGYFPKGSTQLAYDFVTCPNMPVLYGHALECSQTPNPPPLPWYVTVDYSGGTYTAYDGSTVIIAPQTVKWEAEYMNNQVTMVPR